MYETPPPSGGSGELLAPCVAGVDGTLCGCCRVLCELMLKQKQFTEGEQKGFILDQPRYGYLRTRSAHCPVSALVLAALPYGDIGSGNSDAVADDTLISRRRMHAAKGILALLPRLRFPMANHITYSAWSVCRYSCGSDREERSAFARLALAGGVCWKECWVVLRGVNCSPDSLMSTLPLDVIHVIFTWLAMLPPTV